MDHQQYFRRAQKLDGLYFLVVCCLRRKAKSQCCPRVKYDIMKYARYELLLQCPVIYCLFDIQQTSDVFIDTCNNSSTICIRRKKQLQCTRWDMFILVVNALKLLLYQRADTYCYQTVGQWCIPECFCILTLRGVLTSFISIQCLLISEYCFNFLST